MKKLRKEKELEIFQEFQNHQDRMCELLQGQLQQEATDEDQRIAKAVQEQDAKRDVSHIFSCKYNRMLFIIGCFFKK